MNALGVSACLLESVWLVQTDLSTAALRDALLPHIDRDDSILVVKSGGSAAWRKLNVPGETLKRRFS